MTADRSERKINPISVKKRALNRYQNHIQKIMRLEKRVAQLEDRICSLSSPKYSDMPKGGPAQTVEDLIIEKADAERRIKHLRENTGDIRMAVYYMIDKAETTRYGEILELKYIHGMTHEQISGKMHVVERHVARLINDAVKSIIKADCEN